MKKIVFIMMLLCGVAMSVALVSCGGSDDNNNSEDVTPTLIGTWYQSGGDQDRYVFTSSTAGMRYELKDGQYESETITYVYDTTAKTIVITRYKSDGTVKSTLDCSNVTLTAKTLSWTRGTKTENFIKQ